MLNDCLMVVNVRFPVMFLLAAIIFFIPLSSSAQGHPNVILIVADDMGWGDMSLHKNPLVETPHLDRLAKNGKEFSHYYVSPLCAPSRASILTGRYHLSTGVVSVSRGLEIMDSEETTLAELFKANGYTTGIFGKWHNGEHYPHRPNDQGFDEFLGFCAGHLSNYFDATLDRNNDQVKTKGYITDVLTDAAMQFINTNRNKPFFCYIPFNAPHSPHQVADKYFDKYKRKGLNNELAAIYGMVDNMDENIGRLLQFLEKSGLDENTIVIFLSDNGPNGNRFNGNMRGVKGSVHEGGVRVPFFIRWKNQVVPGLEETPVAHIDLYPTLADMCRLEPIPGRPIAGLSMAPLIFNRRDSFDRNRNIYTHVNFMEVPAGLNSGSFRNNRYRFVYENGKPQLYDLNEDPAETSDLATVKSELTQQYVDDYKSWFNDAAAQLNYQRPVILSAKGVILPAYEATLTPGIKFKEGHGWAHDWIAEWNTTDDSVYWEIDCKNPGKYNVEIDYQCAKGEIGSRIVSSIGSEKKETVIDKAFQGKQVASPDRVPRKEAYELDKWGRMHVGTFDVKGGKQRVTIRALNVQKNNVAEVRAIRLIAVQ